MLEGGLATPQFIHGWVWEYKRHALSSLPSSRSRPPPVPHYGLVWSKSSKKYEMSKICQSFVCLIWGSLTSSHSRPPLCATMSLFGKNHPKTMKCQKYVNCLFVWFGHHCLVHIHGHPLCPTGHMYLVKNHPKIWNFRFRWVTNWSSWQNNHELAKQGRWWYSQFRACSNISWNLLVLNHLKPIINIILNNFFGIHVTLFRTLEWYAWMWFYKTLNRF